MKVLWPKVAQSTHGMATLSVSIPRLVFPVASLESISMMFDEADSTIAALRDAVTACRNVTRAGELRSECLAP